jgi:hypothetical protein
VDASADIDQLLAPRSAWRPVPSVFAEVFSVPSLPRGEGCGRSLHLRLPQATGSPTADVSVDRGPSPRPAGGSGPRWRGLIGELESPKPAETSTLPSERRGRSRVALLMADAPGHCGELTELGDQLREAHLSADGRRLRELTPRRHHLVQALVRTAEAQAMASGRTMTAAVPERLTETLDAAPVDPGRPNSCAAGRLVSALRHVWLADW